jgi:ComF family protein
MGIAIEAGLAQPLTLHPSYPRSVRGTRRLFSPLESRHTQRYPPRMDAEASPSRSIATHLRGALGTAYAACKHTARLALDIALPTLCVACREPVDGEGVCASCWSKLSFIAPPYCPRLGIPFVYDPGPELLSMEAIANPPAYQRARAAVRYDDVARTLVHALKYQDRTDLAPAMGRWMARAGRELLGEADALVPVPLHWRRGWSRRYNQSGALARVIERQTGVRLASEALRRVRPTQQQIGLSRSQRATNVQGAFKVAADRKADIQGRRVVLIDDVLTSGATVDACARALLRAKAASVDVLVFARVVDTHKPPI